MFPIKMIPGYDSENSFFLTLFLLIFNFRVVSMVEINFLCVHKKLRSKRVAPVLIREITRRVNLEGIFQAVYTAGIVLPKPVGTCRYVFISLLFIIIARPLLSLIFQIQPHNTIFCVK